MKTKPLPYNEKMKPLLMNISSLLAMTMLIAGSVLAGDGKKAAEKPNILFVFADDHAYDSVGMMSDGYVKTPTIDKLASEGVYFERAYNMGSWYPAVCVASRTMLSTGRSVWRAKQLFNSKQLSSQPTWSQRMQKAGYSTFFVGKWHVKHLNPKKLFDQWGTVRPGMPRTRDDHWRPVEGKEDTWSPTDTALDGYWEGGKHWSEVTADETIAYLKQRGAAEDGKPFFAYVSFNAPHDPRQSPQEYLDLYPVESVPLPKSFMPSYPYTKDIGVWGIRGETLAPRPRTEFAVKTHRREYYALISHMDAQLGRILAELDKQGMRENTVIIYSADQGLSVGNHSFFCKQSMYEHSLAVPFVISGPNIPKGVRSKQRIYIQDAMPTTLELSGLPKAEYADVDFESLLPLDEKGSQGHTSPIYGGYQEKSRCIIQGDWKLMYYPAVKIFRLYNLKKDPHELFDVADNPENRPVIDKLLGILLDQQKQLGDSLPIKAKGI